MALPKIDSPIFTTKLISTGKEVKFRPFTVKEEKLFLIANESDDPKTITDAIIQVLNNCILDDTKVDSLPLFDIEYLFLNLRARSIGEVVDLNYRCNNLVKDDNGEEKKCNNKVEIKVNLLEIKPTISEEHKSKIEINDKLGIVMKYPTMDSVGKIEGPEDLDEVDMVVEMILSCIDYIYDENSVYYAKDSTKEELLEFIESLSTKDMEKLKVFFDTLPKLSKKVEFKCSKCGYTEDIDIEGLQSFFM